MLVSVSVIVIVFVAPVPLATTPLPTKLSMSAVVARAEPSSWTVTPPLPPAVADHSNPLPPLLIANTFPAGLLVGNARVCNAPLLSP